MYAVERINEYNYNRFEDMLHWRANGNEREPVYDAVSDEVKRELADPNLYVYAAEADGRYVGWISLVYLPKVSRVKRGYVYVDELWVAPPYRGRGIAKRLMAEADALCAELIATGVRLYVNVENPTAKQLYENCGYAGEEKAYFMEK